jgi:ribose transport system substrate-binding protein
VQAYRRRRARTARTVVALCGVGGVALLGATYGFFGGSVAAGAVAGHAAAKPKLAPGVLNAEKDLAKIEKGVTSWTGPTSGPKGLKNKFIVIVNQNLSTQSQTSVTNAVTDAATTLHWKVTVIDGQGSLPALQAGIAQAVALKPDAIVADSIPNSLLPQLAQALQSGIPIVCHGTGPGTGPQKASGCSTNVSQNYTQLGQAEADWAIINSGGHLRDLSMTDPAYSVIVDKNLGAINQFKKMGCTGCKVVLNATVPFADEATTLPTLTTGWVQQFDPTAANPLYMITPTDVYAQSIVPALKTAGVAPGAVVIAATDGSPSDYGYVRTGLYQEEDTPDPYGYFGYQVVDNINRLLSHAPLSNPNTPIWAMDRQNINQYGGDTNTFVLPNNYVSKFQLLWTYGKLKKG